MVELSFTADEEEQHEEEFLGEQRASQVTAGVREIDTKMGGGIPKGSLTLIEGQIGRRKVRGRPSRSFGGHCRANSRLPSTPRRRAPSRASSRRWTARRGATAREEVLIRADKNTVPSLGSDD